MKKFLIPILLALVAAMGFYWYEKDLARITLPTPQTYQNFPRPTSNTPPPTNTPTLPSEINLRVPFTSQAPHKIWDEDHGEFCEEASALMAAHFILGQQIPDPDYAEARLQEIKSFEMSEFGYFKDTTAAETAVILEKFYNLKNVDLIYAPSLSEIKETLAAGKIILMPAAGRMLGNPNFTGAGPLYHMIVLKGYTQDGKIITNDPGTRKGADYIYEPDVLLNAMHDWNGGDVNNGQKVIIVVG